MERLSLLHVCKFTIETTHHGHQLEPAISIPTASSTRSRLPGVGAREPYEPDWYIRDPRWLSARPLQLGWNPLADLPCHFPNLRRLELAITQITGPMLLRLVCQTQLSVLTLTQVGALLFGSQIELFSSTCRL